MTACPQRTLRLELPGVQLSADLLLPPAAEGLVLFVHGSGSSRFSPRNRQVAQEFAARGLATLLFDLLSEAEQRIDRVTCELRFDIALLERRILGVIDWLGHDAELAPLRLGLFGASTGAAAALRAAAERPQRVCAVVSRGGRSDLAGAALARVQAPTLQIVGSADPSVWRLNREASRQLPGEQQLQVIPGATHLFEEPGAMEEVARLAGDWFARYLAVASTQPAAP